MHIIAKKENWWRFYTSIPPKISGSVPFIIGPEFIAALWTLKYHYGKFLKFIIINGIGHFLIAFPGVRILKQLNIVSLVRFKPIHVALLFLLRGLSLYGFQFAIDSMKKKKTLYFGFSIELTLIAFYCIYSIGKWLVFIDVFESL